MRPTHSIRLSTVGYVFQGLRVGATFWDRRDWWPLYFYESQNTFEVQHGIESERHPYNVRSLDRACSERRTVHGQHGGLSDLFVPVVTRDRLHGVLVTGPFYTSRPTSAEILERWRWLTGRQGHPSDPEFAHYLSVTLATLVLEGGRFATYQRLAGTIARLMTNQGRSTALENEMESLRTELEPVRFVERTWEIAQSMVDARTTRVWSSPNYASHLALLGLRRAPDHVLVGLGLTRQAALDPVDDAVRRDAFQRACVPLARSMGDVVAGRVSDHGVMFLSAITGSRGGHKLEELVDRVSALARAEFGLSMHFGSSAASASAGLSANYQQALDAAESALLQGARLVRVERTGARSPSPLWKLRMDLAAGVEERAGALPARFDRYIEAIARHSGHRIDLARAHLDAGLETVAKVFVKGGALDLKSFGEMCEALDRAAAEARTAVDVYAAYRRAVADMTAAVQQPVGARHERSLRRAVDYIHQRYSERLSASRVASVAGFAPKYFSLLFKTRERMTFEAYLRRVRIDRARQLLRRTDLNLTRVAELSGFRSAPYLCQVFRQVCGSTPMKFRERAVAEVEKTAKARR